MPATSIETPVGRLGLFEYDGHIVRLTWASDADDETPLLQEARDQITAYFEGSLKTFDLPLAPAGSEFQKTVFDIMSAIPLGETMTYGQIAKKLETFAQPVGQACGANPIPVIIPCHRVLSSSGLGGFSGAGGVETKISLLRHEDAYPFLI